MMGLGKQNLIDTLILKIHRKQRGDWGKIKQSQNENMLDNSATV